MKKEYLLRVDLDIFLRLKEVAAKIDRSVSWIIRQAIMQYLARSKK
jgi:predicted transcriptional regulator